MPTTKRKKSSTSEANGPATVYQVQKGWVFNLFGARMIMQIAVVGGVVLAVFTAWNVNSLAGGWTQQVQAHTAGQLLYNVDAAALRAVTAVEQSYMGTLRHRNSVLTIPEHARAKRLALKHLKASLGSKGMKALRKAVGDDLDELLQGSIEAAVYELKAGQLGMRRVVPLFPVQPSSLEDGGGRRPLLRSSL
ncbi:MAG: hypothetical protein AAF471_08620 [Myxococcota bacterium]